MPALRAAEPQGRFWPRFSGSDGAGPALPWGPRRRRAGSHFRRHRQPRRIWRRHRDRHDRDCGIAAELESGTHPRARAPVRLCALQTATRAFASGMNESPRPVREIVIAPTQGWHLVAWRELYAYRDLLWLLVWRD